MAFQREHDAWETLSKTIIYIMHISYASRHGFKPEIPGLLVIASASSCFQVFSLRSCLAFVFVPSSRYSIWHDSKSSWSKSSNCFLKSDMNPLTTTFQWFSSRAPMINGKITRRFCATRSTMWSFFHKKMVDTATWDDDKNTLAPMQYSNNNVKLIWIESTQQHTLIW